MDNSVSPNVDSGALPRIRSLLPSLLPADQRVAAVILDQATKILSLSVADVAVAAAVSPSTVVRACQRMGFRGFQHLKLILIRETAPDGQLTYGDLNDDDPPSEILSKVLASEARALGGVLETIDKHAFEQAVYAIGDATRILFSGVGTSAPLAQDAGYRFLTIGIESEAPADIHVQHVKARLLGAGDLCVIVSHTGATRETVAIAKAAHDARARTLAITSFKGSPLAKLVDILLVAGGPEMSFRGEAMASRIAHMCVLDALFVAVAMARPDVATRALDLTASTLVEHRF